MPFESIILGAHSRVHSLSLAIDENSGLVQLSNSKNKNISLPFSFLSVSTVSSLHPDSSEQLQRMIIITTNECDICNGINNFFLVVTPPPLSS